MRKHKSVVAILLAVMMIFTFMPTMVFADSPNTTFKWNDGFKTASYGGSTITATWKYYSSNVYADLTTDSNGNVIAIDEHQRPRQGRVQIPTGMTVAHIEFDGQIVGTYAFFYVVDGATFTNVSDNVSYTFYHGLEGDDAALTLVNPNDASVKTNKGSSLGYWDVTYDIDENLKSGAAPVDAKIDLSSTASASLAEMNGKDISHAAIVGKVATKTVNVSAEATVQTNFYDAADTTKAPVDPTNPTEADLTNKPYDGKEHTLVVDSVEGYSVKYQKYDNGTWVDVTEVKYKDVQKAPTTFRAVYTQTALTPAITVSPTTRTVKVGPQAVANPVVSWADGNSKPIAETVPGVKYYLTNEQAADPTAFLVYSNGLAEKAADIDTIKAYFNDRYEITVTKNAANENIQTWTVKQKAEYDKADAKKALAKKYETLVADYAIDSDLGLSLANLAPIEVYVEGPAVVNDKTDDITFTGVTTKAFKAKKKTKKLAKTKTFQVAAAADSGNAITFTGTSSNAKVSINSAGKVTVKKGLKKGTKVTLVVKAKTVAGNGYKGTVATQTYTIKVK